MLVHGFPESWWVFHKLIPLLQRAPRYRPRPARLRRLRHRDRRARQRDRGPGPERLIARLDVGSVHLTGQDISGPTTFRVTATRPDLVRATRRSRQACPASASKPSRTSPAAAPGTSACSRPGHSRTAARRARAGIPRAVRDPVALRVPRRIHRRRHRRTRPLLRATRRVQRSSRTVSIDAPRRRRNPPTGIPETHHARTRRRRQIRRVHPGDPAPGRRGRQLPRPRRHWPLRRDGSPRQARGRHCFPSTASIDA